MEGNTHEQGWRVLAAVAGTSTLRDSGVASSITEFAPKPEPISSIIRVILLDIESWPYKCGWQGSNGWKVVFDRTPNPVSYLVIVPLSMAVEKSTCIST